MRRPQKCQTCTTVNRPCAKSPLCREQGVDFQSHKGQSCWKSLRAELECVLWWFSWQPLDKHSWAIKEQGATGLPQSVSWETNDPRVILGRDSCSNQAYEAIPMCGCKMWSLAKTVPLFYSNLFNAHPWTLSGPSLSYLSTSCFLSQL